MKLLTYSVLVLSLSAAMACGVGREERPTIAPTKTNPCPKLEDRLYRLAQAQEPAQFAQQTGLHYLEGRVRVVIEMVDLGAAVPTKYPLLVESRSDGLIQALVPLDILCDLSQEPQVKLVRSPLAAVPLGG